MTKEDRKYLGDCIILGSRAEGKVSPNPAVGCIIVKDGRILSVGYHREFGGAHAEVDAIARSKQDITGATVYVSLEPCSHFGKTPPCADLLVSKNIARVVIGMTDPNPLVSGKGIAKLKNAGIEVEVADLPLYRNFYRKFTKYITSDFPFVTIKSALTLDGKIAGVSGESKWITGEKSRRLVHLLRSKHDAVLTSSKTVLVDDPMLTVRHNHKPSPKRVMVTSKLFFQDGYNFFRNDDRKSFIVTLEEEQGNGEILQKLNWFQIPIIFVKPDKAGKPDMVQTLKGLHSLGITSVMVEAGAKLTTEMINSDLFDEFVCFIAPKLMGNGINLFDGISNHGLAKAKKLKLDHVKQLNGDVALFFSKMEQ